MTQELVFPSVEHWLSVMPESRKKEILAVVKKIDKNCTTCYWMQFRIKVGKKADNRTCHYPGPLKQDPADDQSCLCWRLDPEYKTRGKGIKAFIT